MGNANKKDTNIIIRVDKDSKELFQKIVENNGQTSSKVLNAFIDEVCIDKVLPKSLLNKITFNTKQIINIPFIKKVVKEAVESLNKDVIKKVYLFGSYSRGEETNNSDIDLRIIGKDNMSLFDIGYITSEVEEKTGKKVDIISGEIVDPVMYKLVKEDEICIYEE